MSFDKETRNLLAKTVTSCRRRLVEDITDQLRGVFGLHPDGTVLPLDKLTYLSPDQHAAARCLRDLLDHYTVGAAGSDSERSKAAYERMVLEISFTVLNRLAALRLCEERGLVVECVRNGTKSAGFQMFERISGGALGGRYETYRGFLECLFDELALDLGVLFDRMTPQSAVFPTERCMDDILAELNKPELAHLWTEDETIGWIYQYFNPPEERKAMREASPIPQNNRELAIRNQFFTPRYVVEFLTDNTLGRLWYEMRKSATVLRNECQYIVRRPQEVFLCLGEKPPPSQENETALSQDELFKTAAYIEHRPKKDPRDLRILDPACGSGHFLLYAFDLLERIYEEAWADPESPRSKITGRTLQADCGTLDELRREAPKLIVEHNLHGIDIDPRAVQIAALALWLRAQRSWKRLTIKAGDRPRIAKSNIVTAEPMPGEEEMRQEFAAGLKPRVLGQLVDVIFEKMKLAGEAGSLLNIDEEIKNVVAEAWKQWREGPKQEQQLLFLPGMTDRRPKQQELRFDVKGITNERFWEQAEDCILDTLKEYAKRAEDGWALRRRLFAEDASRGFAFVDICRKRYDVVLMNPPFGEPTKSSDALIQAQFRSGNLLCAFAIRCLELAPFGFVGSITDSTWLKKADYSDFRSELITRGALPHVLADLGWGVLDGANVATCAIVYGNGSSGNQVLAVRLVDYDSDDRGNQLQRIVCNLFPGVSRQDTGGRVFLRTVDFFKAFPENALAYETPSMLSRAFSIWRPLAQRCIEGRRGYTPGDTFRFFRCWWEISATDRGSRWWTLNNGSPFAPLVGDRFSVALYDTAWKEYRPLSGFRLESEEFFGRPGIGYGKRTDYMYAYPFPAGAMFSNEGHCLFTDEEFRWSLLAYLNSTVCQVLINLYCGQHKTAGYVVKVPAPDLGAESLMQAGIAIKDFWIRWREVARHDEIDEEFTSLLSVSDGETLRSVATTAMRLDADYKSVLAHVDNHVCLLLNTKFEELFVEVERLLVGRPSASIARASRLVSSDGRISPAEILQFAVGVSLGRWDVRIALDRSLVPKLPEPFDSLPVCPPGMLVGPEGLPAEPNRIASEEWLCARPDANTLPPEGTVKCPSVPDDAYPLHISWDGILVDDPGLNGSQPHRDDIVRRVREVLDLLWKDKAHEIEREACDILGISDLRDYFRKPSGFFQDHLKRYSKSRRKAPIYWPLSTASGSYTIWLYYHRLNDQILYAAVNKYVEPKITDVERRIIRIEDELKAASGRDVTRLTDRLGEARAFLGELRDLREDFLQITALPFKPNLNDGVIINAAPFRKHFRLRSWAKDTDDCWKNLQEGDYDWSHLAFAIWPDRVRETCRTDRSIAIAHGLEDLFKEERPQSKRRRGRKAKQVLSDGEEVGS